MDDTGELLSIGAFARQVGLAPSALRFYDDCGVLRPDQVDGATGYRRYAAEQAARAVRLRRLREAGLPLVDVAVVLDGPQEAAREVLRDHLERMRRTADEAHAVVAGFLREAPGGVPGEATDGNGWARARVGGAELASAVRQVAPAAARGATAQEMPVLGCVALELADGEVRLIATDRYRLAVRVLRPEEFAGGPRQVLIGADAARSLAEWAVRQVSVDVECDGETAGVRLRSGANGANVGDWREVPEPVGTAGGGSAEGHLAKGAARFPDYRMVLEDLAAERQRLIVDRVGLRDAVAGRSGVVSLSVPSRAKCEAEGRQRAVSRETRDGLVDVSRETAEADPEAVPMLEVAGGDRQPVRLKAVLTGRALRIAFDPAVLVPALEAGVGPDVLMEIVSADRPVVVRSADQGSFTTLVMPVRGAGGRR
ncbi:MerR family transcriptional regulator [Streptomyces endophytica]|uniref:MerR family transcriptional regulator n=1 Tax=Streptomyces endophytica TaxID=2991496 RepID=A0ABY6PAM6_9ACTN|nr:MerR family transcriptional regulator [Streptomyces endophytica]UZJ30430.1 MerR family transcriptional regulator [Streptomyces endophytica]